MLWKLELPNALLVVHLIRIRDQETSTQCINLYSSSNSRIRAFSSPVKYYFLPIIRGKFPTMLFCFISAKVMVSLFIFTRVCISWTGIYISVNGLRCHNFKAFTSIFVIYYARVLWEIIYDVFSLQMATQYSIGSPTELIVLFAHKQLG